MENRVDLSHPVIMKKLIDYLTARKRPVPDVGGICYGASLMLLTYVYEAMDSYYKTNPDNNNPALLLQLIKEASDKYYERITSIVNYPNIFDINNPEIKKKWQLRETLKWYEANNKFQQAIENKLLNLTNINKLISHHEALFNLAEEQNILSNEEIGLLRAAHIMDIPVYEDFLNEITLMQTSCAYIDGPIQASLSTLFPLLQKNNAIPSPIEEEGASFVMTPLEIANEVSNIIPQNKLIMLSTPGHGTCVIRMGDEYLFYDINRPEKMFYTTIPEIFVSHLSVSISTILLGELIASKQMNHAYMVQNNIVNIRNLEQRMLAEKDPAARLRLIESNMNLLPSDIGFSISIYSHPSATPLSKNWQQLMLDMQKNKLDKKDFKGETILWKACRLGHYEFIKKLIERNYSVNIKDNEGTTAFFIACQSGYLDIMKLLYSKIKNVNIANTDGTTGLAACTVFNQYDSAKWLLDNGAKIALGKKLEKRIKTPLEFAAEYGRVDMLKLLINYDAKITNEVMQTAVVFDKPEIIRILVTEYNYNVNTKFIENWSLLMEAAGEGNIRSMRTLIELGADVNAVSTRDQSVLSLSSKSIESLQLLQQHHVDIHQVRRGNNLLHFACYFGNKMIVEYLLNMKADPNLQNEPEGYTPLIMLITARHFDLVDLLLKEGVQLNLKAKDGKTALDFAILQGQVKLALDLLKRGALCSVKPEPLKIPQGNSNPEQKMLNEFITNFPSIFIKGETIAEKTGLIFLDLAGKSSGMKFFDQGTQKTIIAANSIQAILLLPENKNWDLKQIENCLEKHFPLQNNIPDIMQKVMNAILYFLPQEIQNQIKNEAKMQSNAPRK